MRGKSSTFSQSTVEQALLTWKLRLATGYARNEWAAKTGFTIQDIEDMEKARIPISEEAIKKFCKLAGLHRKNFQKVQIDTMFNEAGINPASLIPSNLPPAEFFDLIKPYELLRQRPGFDLVQISKLLTMLIKPDFAPHSESKKYG